MSKSKVIITAINEDLSNIRLSNADKIYIMYDRENSEPTITLGLFEILKNIKANICFIPADMKYSEITIAMLYVKEIEQKNNVSVVFGLLTGSEDIYERIYQNIFLSSKQKEKSKATRKPREKKYLEAREEVIVKSNNNDNFIMPEPIEVEDKENIDSSKDNDALDIYMNELEKISPELLLHANHIRDAFILNRDEKEPFNSAIIKTAGDINGNKILELLGNNISSIGKLALSFED